METATYVQSQNKIVWKEMNPTILSLAMGK